MKYILFILCFYITGLSVSQSASYQSLILKDTLKKNANSCIRKSSTRITIKSQDKMIIEHKQIITVFNKYGNKDIDAYLHYDKNISVKNLEALVYDAYGNEIKKYKKRDFRDVSAVNGGTLYSDSRVYYLDYTPIDYPYTVEFIYEIKNSNTAFVKSWRPVRNYYQSVESSEFIIEDNTYSNLRYKEKNLDFFNGISVQKSKQKVSCSAEMLPAIKYESYSPSLSSFTPQVHFALTEFSLEGVKGKASNWQEMGKWQYENLIRDRDEVTEETKKEILRLTEGIDDPLKKVKIVYKYVQDNTRYISVQVGIGGWQPIDAETVDNVKYGDCKGLTNYTKALLKIAGIDARYSVVYAGSEKRNIDEDFASMQGNHVILNVPFEDKDLWLECTSQDIPFGFLGTFTDDRKVLVIDESGGELKNTQSYFSKDNYQKIDANIKLDGNGDLKADLNIVSKGTQFYNKYSLADKSKKNILKYYKSHYDKLKALKIETFQFTKDEENVKFSENITLKTEKYCSKFGNRLMIVPNVFNQSIKTPDRYEKRLTPFTISRGFFDEDRLIFDIPDNFTIESMPKPIEIKSKFGSYFAKISQEKNGGFLYERSMLLNHGEFSKEEYPAFRDFMKSVRIADQSKIILIKKT